jgi:hypothetical protein
VLFTPPSSGGQLYTQVFELRYEGGGVRFEIEGRGGAPRASVLTTADVGGDLVHDATAGGEKMVPIASMAGVSSKSIVSGVDFGAVPVGLTVYRTVAVANDGDVDFPFVVELDADGPVSLLEAAADGPIDAARDAEVWTATPLSRHPHGIITLSKRRLTGVARPGRPPVLFRIGITMTQPSHVSPVVTVAEDTGQWLQTASTGASAAGAGATAMTRVAGADTADTPPAPVTLHREPREISLTFPVSATGQLLQLEIPEPSALVFGDLPRSQTRRGKAVVLNAGSMPIAISVAIAVTHGADAGRLIQGHDQVQAYLDQFAVSLGGLEQFGPASPVRPGTRAILDVSVASLPKDDPRGDRDLMCHIVFVHAHGTMPGLDGFPEPGVASPSKRE